MGVYDTSSITTTDFSQRISSLANYLNDISGISAEETFYEHELVQYDGVLFTFEDADISGFYGYHYNSSTEKTSVLIRLTKSAVTELIAPTVREYNGIEDLVVHSYSDDICKIIAIRDSVSGSSGIEVMTLEADNGYNLAGYSELYTQDTSTFADISTLTFENIMDSARIPYAYTNMFPYTAAAGTIDFLAQGYFVNNQIRKYKSSFLKECSTVTLLSTVSLPSPLDNHLAIGAHCLVPVEEGGN